MRRRHPRHQNRFGILGDDPAHMVPQATARNYTLAHRGDGDWLGTGLRDLHLRDGLRQSARARRPHRARSHRQHHTGGGVADVKVESRVDGDRAIGERPGHAAGREHSESLTQRQAALETGSDGEVDRSRQSGRAGNRGRKLISAAAAVVRDVS